MSAIILPFSQRRERVRPPSVPAVSPEEALISRCRQIAFGWELNAFDRAVVARAVQIWLNCGLGEQVILQRADAMAKRLAASHNPTGPRAA